MRDTNLYRAMDCSSSVPVEPPHVESSAKNADKPTAPLEQASPRVSPDALRWPHNTVRAIIASCWPCATEASSAAAANAVVDDVVFDDDSVVGGISL